MNDQVQFQEQQKTKQKTKQQQKHLKYLFLSYLN
jgi:hypothetical protein